MSEADPHDLERFVAAQAPVIEAVRGELRGGRKTSHWMWFVFPQVRGLGSSPTARHYALRGLEEARAYLDHPVLGPRLLECCRLLVPHAGRSAGAIFGSPDDMKLRSCLTLFGRARPQEPLFAALLDQFYRGEEDGRTLEVLSGG